MWQMSIPGGKREIEHSQLKENECCSLAQYNLHQEHYCLPFLLSAHFVYVAGASKDDRL